MRLHYVRRGGGEPVVLLHGWPGFWYDWRHVIVPLAEEADVIALDFRGFGDSDKLQGDPKDLYTQDHLTADVLAMLDHLRMIRGPSCYVRMYDVTIMAPQRATDGRRS